MTAPDGQPTPSPWDLGEVITPEGAAQEVPQENSAGTVEDVKTLPAGTILPVTGVSFRQDAVRACHVGQEIVLRHDVTNSYDKWAVAVETEAGTQLGFIPAKGGVAQRLSESTPGGTWQARVVEVLAGETTGLRIRLVGPGLAQDPRPGSDRRGPQGRRERVDGVNEDGTLEPPSALSGTSQEGVVSGPGGRILGTLVEQGSTTVRVRAADGTIRAYPTSLVTIRRS